MVYPEEIINNIKDILTDREETIAVAESVTAGNLQAALSIAMEAKKFYQGGITTYNLGQKARHLNVEPIHSESVDCISEKVAHTMAVEVGRLFTSNYGIGITGYASLMPGKNELYAYVAVAHEGKVVYTKRLTSAKEKPYEVQVDYTNQVLHLFYAFLQKP